jgi:flagellar FliL protein
MKKLMLIVLVVAGVLLGVGGTAAFFLMGPKPAVAEGAAEPELGPPGIISMETFLVNVPTSTGDGYVKVNMRLAVTPASLTGAVEGDELLQAKLRDRVLTLLTSKSAEELISPLGKEGFRREIKSVLGPLLDGGEIQEVLFSEFVVQ